MDKKKKNAPSNHKTMLISAFNIQSHFLYIMNKLKGTCLEFQKLNPILTILIGKILSFHHKNKIT